MVFIQKKYSHCEVLTVFKFVLGTFVSQVLYEKLSPLCDTVAAQKNKDVLKSSNLKLKKARTKFLCINPRIESAQAGIHVS